MNKVKLTRIVNKESVLRAKIVNIITQLMRTLVNRTANKFRKLLIHLATITIKINQQKKHNRKNPLTLNKKREKINTNYQ
jgi:hypothetical protein